MYDKLTREWGINHHRAKNELRDVHGLMMDDVVQYTLLIIKSRFFRVL